MSKAMPLVICLLILSVSCAEENPLLGSKDSPIIGGTKETGYPSVGAVIFDAAMCTGTLISPKVVLTAAHCLQGGSGKVFLIGPSVNNPTTQIEISAVEKHPNYNPGVWEGQAEVGYHDIAIAVLKTASTVTPMKFKTSTLSPSYEGKDVTFIGYGTTSTKPWEDNSGTKYRVTVKINDIWSQGWWNYTTPGAPKNTCSGDSGGPGFVTESGVDWIVGVVSSGDSTCQYDGYNTRIDVNAEWITQMLKKYDPGSLTGTCGDGTCGVGETTASCPADCTTTGPKCGDGTCDSGETATSCPADCKTGGDGQLWDKCESSDDCAANLFCVGGNNEAYCTQGCDKPNSFEGCPTDYFCFGLANGGQNGIPAGACIPKEYVVICGDGTCDSPDETQQNCPADCGGTQPDPCDKITFEGCCDGNVVKYCVDGTYAETDCAKEHPDRPICSWVSGESYYGCGSSAASDPSGINPKSCTPLLTPKCGDGFCTGAETKANCPGDCGGTTGPVCGNGKCETGETTANCAADCPASGPVCGNGKCETGETTAGCPADCQPAGPVCGDGNCEGPTETSANCLADCGPAGPVCGDGSCEEPENNANCPADCSTGSVDCGLVGYEGCCDQEKVAWCENGQLKAKDCAKSPACGWNANGEIYDCNTDGAGDPTGAHPKQCESLDSPYVCGNKICEVGENGHSCPADCDSGEGECGNNVCEERESCTNCPSDCGECMDTVGGDDIVAGEDTGVSFTGQSSSSCSQSSRAGGPTGGLLGGLLAFLLVVRLSRRRLVPAR